MVSLTGRIGQSSIFTMLEQNKFWLSRYSSGKELFNDFFYKIFGGKIRSFNLRFYEKFHRASYKILSPLSPARADFSQFSSPPGLRHNHFCTPAALSFVSRSYVPSAYIPQKLFRMQLRRPSSNALIGQHISPKQREFFRITKFRSFAQRWQANRKTCKRDAKIRIENETIEIYENLTPRII